MKWQVWLAILWAVVSVIAGIKGAPTWYITVLACGGWVAAAMGWDLVTRDH